MDSLMFVTDSSIASAASDSVSIATQGAFLARYATSENLAMLTWIWCIAIGVLFVTVVSWHLVRNVGAKSRQFRNAARTIQRSQAPASQASSGSGVGRHDSPFGKSRDLGARWSAFKKAWADSVPDGADAGSVDPEIYFPPVELLGGATFLRKLEGWPGRFLTLGILGTFVGIALGLASLDGNAGPEKLLPVVITMIAGLTTSFVTSIVGITCSLVFLFMERREVGAAYKAIDDFLVATRLQYPVRDPEALLADVARSTALSADSLRGLENDLAASLSESFGDVLTERLTPLIEDIQETLSKVTDATSTAQVEGIERVIDKFMQGMDEQLGGSFSRLGEDIQNASTNLTAVSASLEAAAQRQELLIQKTMSTAEVLDRQLPHLLSFGRQLDNAAGTFERAITRVGDLEERLSKGTDQLMELQKATESRFESTVQRLSELGELVKSTSEMQGQSQERMEKAYESALDSFEKNLRDGLIESLKTFDGVLGQVMERFSGTLADLREQYSAVDRHTEALQESVSSISTSLASSLNELGEVSTQAHEKIRDLSEAYMQNTTEGLKSSTEAIDGLKANVQQIATASNQLAEQVSKLTAASAESNSNLATVVELNLSSVQTSVSSATDTVSELGQGLQSVKDSFAKLDHTIEQFVTQLTDTSMQQAENEKKRGLFGRFRG